jgi:hypothetical protein
MPGPAPRPRARHRPAADALRARPGEWAHVTTHSTAQSSASLAYAIRAGKYAAYTPAGHFEARARTVDGEHRVYVRYVGFQQ